MATTWNNGIFTMDEFKSRGVVKLAPDLLVYISGNLGETVIAPVSSTEQNVSFNDGITSVGIQNNIDNPGSSTASIEVTTPIYGEDSKYWVKIEDGKNTYRSPVFVPMMEVKIFIKGRFLVKNKPRYYPAFWGFITNVEENFSGGLYKINLQCADMLHWWGYSTVNVHPVPANGAYGEGLNLTAYSTIFKDANPYTIIYRLAKGMGMHEFVLPTWLGQGTPQSQIYPAKAFKAAAKGIMSYWAVRFRNIGSLLKMYGVRGELLDVSGPGGKTIRTVKPGRTQMDNSINSQAKQASTNTEKDYEFFVNNDYISNTYLERFPPFFDFDKMGSFDEAEYRTKLEIATELKNRVDYEFFQDTNGNFVFKPPFYNLRTKNVQPYRIEPSDIQNFSSSVDAEGIVTSLEVQGSYHEAMKGSGSDIPFRGFHMDIDLAQKYGIRHQNLNIQYAFNSYMCEMMAVSRMGIINAKAFSGSVTIPGRPEIRMGYPIYFPHRDSYNYVKSISHSFDYGGSFTTTLAFEAERKKLIDYDEKSKTFSVLKDRVYIKDPKAKLNIKQSPIQSNTSDQKKAELDTHTVSQEYARYRIETRKKAAEEVQSKQKDTSKNKSVKSLAQIASSLQAFTPTTSPLTDEEGYRVIGAFRYGRGVPVTSTTVMDDQDVINNFGVEASMKSDPNVELANYEVTNMSVGSGKESALMDAYADQLNESNGKENTTPFKEGIIPAYQKLTNITASDSSSSNVISLVSVDNLTNAKPKTSDGANVKNEKLANNQKA